MSRGPRIISRTEPGVVEVWPLQPVADGESRNVAVITAKQIEQMQKDAYREGFAQGRQEALARVSQRMEAILQALTGPLQGMEAELLPQLAALVIACARQFIRRELHASPGEIMAVVRQVLEVLPVAARRIKIHLHPEDAVLVRDALSGEGAERRWTIIEDPSISRGGCRANTESSQIDATVETRLNAVAAQMLADERSHAD
jgi:flagellar assembly protein FliH